MKLYNAHAKIRLDIGTLNRAIKYIDSSISANTPENIKLIVKHPKYSIITSKMTNGKTVLNQYVKLYYKKKDS